MLTVLSHLKSQSGHFNSFVVSDVVVGTVNVDEDEDDDVDVNGVDSDVDVVVDDGNVVAGDQCLQL